MGDFPCMGRGEKIKYVKKSNGSNSESKKVLVKKITVFENFEDNQVKIGHDLWKSDKRKSPEDLQKG